MAHLAVAASCLHHTMLSPAAQSLQQNPGTIADYTFPLNLRGHV